jgi:hypothetical protein
MKTHTLKAEVAFATTVGGPTRGAPKMIGGRSPPPFCFSLSWLDSSSTAAPTLVRRKALVSWSLAPAFYTRCW